MNLRSGLTQGQRSLLTGQLTKEVTVVINYKLIKLLIHNSLKHINAYQTSDQQLIQLQLYVTIVKDKTASTVAFHYHLIKHVHSKDVSIY